jgi:hypothetical protein
MTQLYALFQIPQSLSANRYGTIISSNAVGSALDSAIAQGFTSQILEAYSEGDESMHPNGVHVALRETIVCVICILEKASFKGDAQKGAFCQIYANLVEVQEKKQSL